MSFPASQSLFLNHNYINYMICLQHVKSIRSVPKLFYRLYVLYVFIFTIEKKECWYSLTGCRVYNGILRIICGYISTFSVKMIYVYVTKSVDTVTVLNFISLCSKRYSKTYRARKKSSYTICTFDKNPPSMHIYT